MQKLIRSYIYSAGALLLALAAALFISERVDKPLDLVPLRDPIFNLQLPTLFWVMGGILLIVVLVCLLGKIHTIQLILIFWVSLELILCRFLMPLMGIKGGFNGYFGQISDAFGISYSTTASLLTAIAWYLFIGSLLIMIWIWTSERLKRAKLGARMACARCGGHVEFCFQDLGQQIPCPHCHFTITLRQPDFIKMSCFFCKEHIEFPAFAIGQKIACPHCKMDITLQESSI